MITEAAYPAHVGEEEVREVSLEIDSQENIRFTYNLINFPFCLSLRLISLEYPFDRSDRGPSGGWHIRVYLFGSYKDKGGEYQTQPLDASKSQPKNKVKARLQGYPFSFPSGEYLTGLKSGYYYVSQGNSRPNRDPQVQVPVVESVLCLGSIPRPFQSFNLSRDLRSRKDENLSTTPKMKGDESPSTSKNPYP